MNISSEFIRAWFKHWTLKIKLMLSCRRSEANIHYPDQLRVRSSSLTSDFHRNERIFLRIQLYCV